MLDPARMRSHFPTLARSYNGEPLLYFDNPAGTQVPRETIAGYASYLQHSNANVGGAFVTSRETDALLADARQAMADLLGAASSQEIVFGPNMTSLTFQLSHALARRLAPGDEVVITELEHDANVAPWLALAERGVVIKRIPIRPEDVALDLRDVEALFSRRTRLLAVGYASNAFGTVNDVAFLTALAHAHGALVFVDAVHYGPHGPIDVGALGCDLLACSAYKFFGPHLGILYGRKEILDQLPVSHVRPAGDTAPEKWETGTKNHEALAALLGTISYLSSLSDSGLRRDALHHAMKRIQDYEQLLTRRLVLGLASLPRVRIFGITDPADLQRRVPTVSFLINGLDPHEGARRLAERGICSWAGNHYAVEPLQRLRVAATQRVGLVHYNTESEIDRFLEAVTEISG